MEPWGNLLIELRKSRQENVEKIQENPIMGSNRGESCYGVVSINKGGECSSADSSALQGLCLCSLRAGPVSGSHRGLPGFCARGHTTGRRAWEWRPRRDCRRAGTEKYTWQITHATLPLSDVFRARSKSVLRIALANHQGACAVYEVPVFILSRPRSSISDGLPVSEEEFVHVSLCACVICGS